MSLNLPRPIIYLITSGKTTASTSPTSDEFHSILRLIDAAVAAEIPLVQIREKDLTVRVLYELVRQAVERARGSSTNILVNDRSDVASASGAHGVHLASYSLTADIARQFQGGNFLIGVSTHSLNEAISAKERGADFVVFGPVFKTESKRLYGEPQGLENLSHVISQLEGFPVLPIGGITLDNARSCFSAGASGIAAIHSLSDPDSLQGTVRRFRELFNPQ